MLVATDSRLKVLAIVPLRESHKLEQIRERDICRARGRREKREGKIKKGGTKGEKQGVGIQGENQGVH